MMNSRITLTMGGVLLVAVTLVGCSGSGSSYMSPVSPTPTSTTTPTPTPTAAPAAADVTVSIVGMYGNLSYSPNPATVKVGQTVAWSNADGLPHTATADAGAFNTGNIDAGATSSPITMSTAGTFPYHCVIHGFAMTGTLIVTP
ncbi:MAG: cupredoxin domain-containing protein [Acidobacteria bacterium]|nr:cupredoxin domain-containing protein [Acidobacteriota bacterium]